MINRLVKIFRNHSMEVVIAIFIFVFAYAGVFSSVGSIAGAMGLMAMLMMAGLLVNQYLKAISGESKTMSAEIWSMYLPWIARRSNRYSFRSRW